MRDKDTNEKRTTFRVPESNLETLRERIGKLAKRAAKLHVEPPVLTVGTFEDVQWKDSDGFERTRRYFDVTVTGAAPKINGWSFAAVLQPTADENGVSLGNVLRNVPGFEFPIPAEYRAADSKCEHCNLWRRRNETFVLRSEDGIWKQVGRQCLRDFLGHQSPETYATWAEILCDASDLAGLAEDEDWEGGRRVAETFAAEQVLGWAASAVRQLGWTSKKTASLGNSTATAEAVSNYIFAGPKGRELLGYDLTPSDEDKVFAAEVQEWLASLSDRDTSDNDYLYNLSLLGKGATFTTKNFGLACSAIPTYAKEKEREINRKKRFEADLNSQYVGEIGKREIFANLTLVFTTSWESDYGVTFLYKFKDAAGNVIVWFSTSDKSFNQGDTFDLKATVKKHEEREGVKQTIVSRGVRSKP